VDFGDFEVAQEFGRTMNSDRKYRRREDKVRERRSYQAKSAKPSSFSWADQTQRKIATTGGQKLGGEFRWLTTFGNSFDDRGREKGKRIMRLT